MKTLITTLFLAGSLALGGCGDNVNQETQEKKDTTKTTEIKNIGEALDYHLKYTALEIYKQGEELDSLNNYYDSLDKKSDTLVSFWKKKMIYRE